MGVQDFVARFGEQGVYPGIEGDGLLRGVDAARLYRGQCNPLAGQVKICPGQFKGRKGDFRGILLVPAQPAVAVGGGEHTDEVVGPPYDLVPGHAPQLPEILRGRRLGVPEYGFVFAGLALAPPHIAPDVEAVWGINNSEVKGVFRQLPQNICTVHVIRYVNAAGPFLSR